MLLLYYITFAILLLISILFLVSILKRGNKNDIIETFVFKGKNNPFKLVKGIVVNVATIEKKLADVVRNISNIEYKVNYITHVKNGLVNISKTLSKANKMQLDDESYNKEVAVLFDDKLLNENSKTIKINISEEYGEKNPSDKNIKIINFVLFNNKEIHTSIPKPYKDGSYSKHLQFINDEIKNLYDIPVSSDNKHIYNLEKNKQTLDKKHADFVIKKIKTFRTNYLKKNVKNGEINLRPEFLKHWVFAYPEHKYLEEKEFETESEDVLRRHVIAFIDIIDIGELE